jgi:hypothetical protein
MHVNKAFFPAFIVMSLIFASCGGRRARVVTTTESTSVKPNAVDCRHYNDDGKSCKELGIPDGQSTVIGGERWECVEGCGRSLGSELATPSAGAPKGDLDCSAGEEGRRDCAETNPAEGGVPGSDATTAPSPSPAASQPSPPAGADPEGSAPATPPSGDPLGDLASVLGQSGAASTGGGGGTDCFAYNRDGRTCADAGINPGETKQIWGGTWQCVNGCAQMLGAGTTSAGNTGAPDCRAYNRDGLSCSQASLNPGETKQMWGGTWQCVNGCAQLVGG